MGSTGVDMSTPLLPGVVPEIGANLASFYVDQVWILPSVTTVLYFHIGRLRICLQVQKVVLDSRENGPCSKPFSDNDIFRF